MAFGTNVGQDVSLVAVADLTASQFFFIKCDSTGKAALCTGAAGEGYLGVLQDEPDINQAAPVRYGGISKVKCGGSFNPGDYVTSDGSGKAVKYTTSKVFTGTPYIVSGTCVYGLALEAGANNQLAAIVVLHGGLNN